MNRFIEKLNELNTEIENRTLVSNKEKLDKRQFGLMLGCVPSIRSNVALADIKLGENVDSEKIKEILWNRYQIDDVDSLSEALQMLYTTHEQYMQYVSFWENKPLFDLNELSDTAKQHFNMCKDFAYQFYPLLKEKGFFAFDMSEMLFIIRLACHVDIIDEDDVLEAISFLVNKVRSIYSNFEEFAMSYVSGGAFYVYRESLGNEDMAYAEFENMLEVVTNLLTREQYDLWNYYDWKLGVDYFKNLVIRKEYVDKKIGCVVSNRISVEESSIGYMYKDNDSTWTFMAGNEDELYMMDRNNFNTFTLNALCNYDDEIVKYLNVENGSTIMRDDEGKLVLMGKETC